jgi:predicted TIM-barrel fold metal-dependent hydrolase
MGSPAPFSRREFLCATAASLVGARGFCRAAEAGGAWIDAHVHVWTPDEKKYPRVVAPKGKAPIEPRSFTPAELAVHTRAEGVTRVALVQMSFYGFDHRYMLDAIAAHPGTFRGVALVDPEAPRLRETMARLRAAGVRGIRLSAGQAAVERWLESDAIGALWNHAAELEMAICPLTNPDGLQPLQRMCARHPRTTVVIDHIGRIGIDGAIDPAHVDQLCRLAEFERVNVKVSAFYALGAKQAPYTDLAPVVRRLRDAYGAQRLMWGSDCPFQVERGRTYADSIALIRDRLDFLSSEDKSWMLRKTAERVFFS